MTSLFLVIIKFYQKWLSPIFGRSCRFHPTCSHFTAGCIERHGSFWGVLLGVHRVLRCNPFCKGGADPVPLSLPRWTKTAHQGAIIAALFIGAYSFAYANDSEDFSRTTLITKEYAAKVNGTGGGSLVDLNLRETQFQKNGKPLNVVTTNRSQYQPLQVYVEGVGVPENTPWQLDTKEASPNSIQYKWDGKSVRVMRRLQSGKTPFTFWSTVQIWNHSLAPQTLRLVLKDFHYVKRSEEKGGFLASPAHGISHGFCGAGDKLERITREDIQSGKKIEAKHPNIAGLENMYFVKALATEGVGLESCAFRASDRGGSTEAPEGSLLEGVFRYPKVTIGPNQTYTIRTLFFAGPKQPARLRQAGHGLHQVVDLGFFSVIARSLVHLLAFIHRFIPNWGLAIILLTVLVKAVLYPLTERSFRSMAHMRKLKPELDRINELYADNREKKGAATMELYRKNGINPMGGCLPQLLQLPIWWALYTSLSTNVELYNAPFILWWKDLSSPDPFYTLPLMLGGLMVVQQRLTPSTMDPAQAKMMTVMMPIMITAFMLFLPAGLCVYMVTNSVLGIAQQKFIEWRMRDSTPAQATTDGRMERGRA